MTSNTYTLQIVGACPTGVACDPVSLSREHLGIRDAVREQVDFIRKRILCNKCNKPRNFRSCFQPEVAPPKAT